MSKKIPFMRNIDIDIVNDNVDDIMEKARIKTIHCIEPTLNEFNNVKSIILEFIKKEKKIIYGGFAWNYLIKKINPSDAFYSNTSFTDVEFYSNKPIDDLKKLCDILYDNDFKFIQGKNAQHADTYTIFVNFIPYCDISYMPSNLYYTVMTENIDGFRLIHPKFIMVDLLRQFNDPLISFHRLDKNLKRGKLLIKNYPLELSTTQIIIPPLNANTIKLLYHLLPIVAKFKYIIFIGQIATNTFINPTQIINYNSCPVEIISTNLIKDVENIYNSIYKYFIDDNNSNEFINNFLLEQYYPFFQFTDKKAVFKLNGEIFLTIYGNNQKCITYHNITINIPSPSARAPPTEGKNISFPIKISTFNFNFMMTLINFHHAISEKNKHNQHLLDYIMFQLITSRNKYLDNNKKTILDQTLFEDFKVDCLGDPVCPKRSFFLQIKNRNLMQKSSIHPYFPEEHRNNFSSDSYSFKNYSGNIINNPIDLIYNLKKSSHIREKT